MTDMPKTKLTLSVDPTVVAHAKRFSRRHQTTVSELVEGFLASLDDGAAGGAPVSARLRGILPGDTSREDYRKHLEEKHG